MDESFSHTVLGNTGIKVHRLGLAATYRPGHGSTAYKHFGARTKKKT